MPDSITLLPTLTGAILLILLGISIGRWLLPRQPAAVPTRTPTLAPAGQTQLAPEADTVHLRQKESKLQQEAAINAVLSDLLAPLLSPSSTMKDIADSILARARLLTASAHGFVSTIDPATGHNIAHIVSDMMPGRCQLMQTRQAMRFPKGADGHYPGLWGYALNLRQPFYTNFPASHPASTGIPAGHISLERFLSVPVMSGSELVGQIALANADRDYSDSDLQAVQRLAEFYALAIQRWRLADDMEAEKEVLAVTLSSIGDGMIATDAAGKVVLINPVAEELTGWDFRAGRGQPVTKVFHLIDERTRLPVDHPVPRVLQTGIMTGISDHTLLAARDGSEKVITHSCAPIIDTHRHVIGAVLIFRDVSEKQKLTEELLKIDKLESLGVLAGGIAHDFNNILMAILGNISLVALYANDNEAISERLAAAEEATYRARDLVQQLLTFAKGGAPIKEIASLPEIIKDSAIFASRGSQAGCEFSLPEDLWPAEVDPGQISQVIQNLVMNAVQAMTSGGVVMIKAENVTVSRDAGMPLKSGRYVKTLVHDQGIGIPKDQLMKIFDPYYTTKPGGSGLGLATVYSIIKQHDGFITVESSPGAGTSIIFYLPASDQEVVLEKAPRAELITGQGRILVMDDEEMVRVVAGKMLTHLGYEVALAGDGAQALELYRLSMEEGQPFAAVIMDLTVPAGMGGKETMRKLLDLDPQARAIVSSGYAADPIMTHYKTFGFQGCIRKPYKIDNLSLLLARVLQPEG